MGRGLSQQQKKILDLLDGATVIDGIGQVVRTREVMNRVRGSKQSKSRSISRLQDRGLVERLSIQNGKRSMPAIRRKII